MNPFVNYLKTFENLNPEDTELLSDMVIIRQLKTNEYFLSAGEYSNEIGFIEKGVFRILFYDKEGNEITRYFLRENQFVVDLYAFQNRLISGEYIQSVTESRLTILTRDALQILSQKITAWDKMVNTITQNALMEKLYNRSDLVNKDAKTNYLDFIEKNPELANRIPLGYLASYLGIKQQSLSRIRNQIAREGAF